MKLEIFLGPRRLIWKLLSPFLFGCTPIPFFKWRCFILNLFGGSISYSAKVYPKVKIWDPAKLTMKDFSCLANFVDCYNVYGIEIGERSIVSQRSFLCGASHNYLDEKFQLIGGKIIIENDCWVAAEAFVAPGIKLSNRTILLARGVLVKNTQKNEIWAGNPAKKIKNYKIKY
jgi:putative colanic acid biosynthesis acetyltransferase WcaF